MNTLFIKKLWGVLTSASTDSVDVNDTLVVAGNPAKLLTPLNLTVELNDNEKNKVADLKRYQVCGNSMYPCEIANGDYIYVQGVSKNEKLERDSFVVVKVDSSVCKRVGFNHKLRRYLMDVTRDMTKEQIIEKLEKFHKHILLDEYRENLIKKMNKTWKNYPDENNFCLSMTFKDGSLRYSFHPRNLVEGRVKYSFSVRNHKFTETEKVVAY